MLFEEFTGIFNLESGTPKEFRIFIKDEIVFLDVCVYKTQIITSAMFYPIKKRECLTMSLPFQELKDFNGEATITLLINEGIISIDVHIHNEHHIKKFTSDIDARSIAIKRHDPINLGLKTGIYM
jgi:hypothetical protein